MSGGVLKMSESSKTDFLLLDVITWYEIEMEIEWKRGHPHKVVANFNIYKKK